MSGGFNGDDVGDLGDVEQGGDARRHILAEPGGRQEDMRVRGSKPDHERGKVLRRRGGVLRRIGVQGPGHTRDLRRGLRHTRGVMAGDQDVDRRADLLRRSNGVARRRLERRAVMFGDHEDHRVGTKG